MPTREELVLAALAPAKGATHTPVQVQKLLFLIDRNIADEVDGPHFDFQPYNYGPFDRAVYEQLELLADAGHVELIHRRDWNEYKLSPTGQERGDAILGGLSKKAREYIERASTFVRSLSFTELVSAIYKEYPDMRANSVFQS